MTLSELRDSFRRKSGDLAKPYFFTDAELDEWANEAEVEACRRAHLIVDSQGQIAQLSVAAGESVLDIDSRIIAIRRARLSSGRTLRPVVVRSMDESCPGWENATASTPVIYIPDYQTSAIRLHPPSAAKDTVYLTVVRAPMNRMVEDDDCPEIAERYHSALVEYMLAEGFGTADADMFDPKRVERSAANFAAEFGPKISALDERWQMEQYYDIGER